MQFTNEKIMEIARVQSACDANCREEDFLRSENLITLSKKDPLARKYLKLPHVCNMISYGSNVVATISEEYREIVEGYISKYPLAHLFETPNMHVLDDAFAKRGFRICFMAEYFLPDINVLRPLPCDFELRILEPKDFEGLYTEKWSNALCNARKELDVLAVGAYYEGGLVGLAGCSADCETMWQIGIDVAEGYRRKGIASALTSRLATEILARGKVPFYCCAWSNLASARNAIKSGFRPAWVEMTVKSAEFVNGMNGGC
ncbi:MAG: GNAT family N-acetyltransferase [Oscillospiraceae bacterium]|nr:GNAT family N-acetyltransferase [Oscillospiraceae bacterium]